MKNLGNQIIANLHFFIAAWILYSVYIAYEEHAKALEETNTQVVKIENEIRVANTKVGEIQEFVKKADEYRVRVEEVAKNIENVQRQLPADTSDSQIVTYFNQEMSTLNMKESSLIPGKEMPSTYFISKDYGLKAKGTFLQFLIFFERLGTAARIYNVKELKLKITNDGKKGRFQIVNGEGTIQAFRYNPDFKVDRGFEKK